MKGINKNIIFTMAAIFLLASCGNLSNEVENRLNKLKNKTESLDSLINKEVDKVLTIDSILNKEREKVKKLDTLINKSSFQLDSISKKGSRLLEKINN
jgi:predicted site-specific integrase-resolvase